MVQIYILFFHISANIDIVYSKKNDVLCGKCNDNVFPKNKMLCTVK